ncbi:alpha/beta hydrolase [Streptomyces chiangmaiensis]|uniref:Alpha/beta hydrolase n=1 Tax=Streptomyces chiangmaiensis TaxID=766497 RepID=A0ABU7FM96_9ACTN|nr:alpha/beta hydrolase [Streptomyces chiangmaiensis]MED7825064.1 alpha/beta hydrolase [Streptomyces chiangmaiensis]
MSNPHRIRAISLAATAVLASPLLTGWTTGPAGRALSDPTANGASQKLNWKDCPTPSAAEGGGSAPAPLPDGSRWQCATMKAPLNWDDPNSGTIDIALIRVKASGPPSKRIGSLVFNFGGPGGSGVSTLPAFAQDYAALRTRYDLVSFDPRGVGRSSPVICKNDQQLDAFFQQDATPDTAAELTTYLSNTKQFNSACAVNSGKVLPYVRTTDTARDMDLMRKVLGDARLHYFGISYGTELGGVYAHLFPKNVGRAVLDAVVDPTQNAKQSALGQAKGFQLAFDNYVRNCTAQSTGCPIGKTPQDVRNRIAALVKSLDSKPIPGIAPRLLTETAAINGIAEALYSKDFWPYLTEGLQQAYSGDGKVLMLLSDAMNGRSDNGQYSNLIPANVAINCADQKARYTTADVKANLAQFRAASPLFGEFLAWGMISCTNWPVAGGADHPTVSAPGAAPILVIGNTGDPATPYEGAGRMAQALGKGVGVQLTYRGQGHGSYDSGSKCVQNAVNNYLLNGTVPAAGTVCL